MMRGFEFVAQELTARLVGQNLSTQGVADVLPLS